MRNKPNKSELSRWLQTMGLERQQTKRSKYSSQGCTSRSAFQIRSLLLKPLPCILGRKRKQNKPWNSVIPFNPMLGTPYLPPFPLTHSILGSPDRQTSCWRRVGHRRSSAPTCVQDTEHAPNSSPARFQGEKSFPESRLELSLYQQWMSFILDLFQSI